MKLNCSVPYPEIECLKKDVRMMPAVASLRLHEIYSLSDCLYYQLIFEDICPLLSEVFEKIADADTRHFQILGKIILTLGGDPCLRLRHNVPSCALSRDGSRENILRSMIESKARAEAEYLRLCHDFSGDCVAAALFERLAEDERHHKKMLEKLL